MQSSEMDMAGASQQTRTHQKDSHIRLGAAVLFVSVGFLALLNSIYGLAMHWLMIVGLSVCLGLVVGYWAYRHSAKVTAKAREEDRAERKAEKDAQLAAFLEGNEDG